MYKVDVSELRRIQKIDEHCPVTGLPAEGKFGGGEPYEKNAMLI